MTSPTKRELEVAEKWAKGDISLAEAAYQLKTYPNNVYSRLARALKHLIHEQAH